VGVLPALTSRKRGCYSGHYSQAPRRETRKERSKWAQKNKEGCGLWGGKKVRGGKAFIPRKKKRGRLRKERGERAVRPPCDGGANNSTKKIAPISDLSRKGKNPKHTTPPSSPIQHRKEDPPNTRNPPKGAGTTKTPARARAPVADSARGSRARRWNQRPSGRGSY